MKASEVVERLEELIAEHGDREVCSTFMDGNLRTVEYLYDADGDDGETRFYFD